MYGLLFGLIPAFGNGGQQLAMQKIGGKFTNKVMGTVIGALFFAIVVFLFHQPSRITKNLIIGSALCGLFWSVGMILQVKSFDMMGLSRAMPISTGEQLIMTDLFGVLYFHEWKYLWQGALGITAILLIVLGIWATTYQENKKEIANNIKQGMILLLISSIGFTGYAVIPRVYDLNSWDMLLPQAIFMFIGITILVAFQKGNQMWSRKSWQNIPNGLCFAVGNLTILLSNAMNGVAVGWTLSQLNVVISTLGGIFLLHEKKTSKEIGHILCGLLLIVIGAISIGMTKR